VLVSKIACTLVLVPVLKTKEKRESDQIDPTMSQCYAKSRKIFTGNTSSSKNPRFLAINHDVVPCTVDGLRHNGKATAVRFTILRPMCDGFAGAPFKNKDAKRDPESR